MGNFTHVKISVRVPKNQHVDCSKLDTGAYACFQGEFVAKKIKLLIAESLHMNFPIKVKLVPSQVVLCY